MNINIKKRQRKVNKLFDHFKCLNLSDYKQSNYRIPLQYLNHSLVRSHIRNLSKMRCNTFFIYGYIYSFNYNLFNDWYMDLTVFAKIPYDPDQYVSEYVSPLYREIHIPDFINYMIHNPDTDRAFQILGEYTKVFGRSTRRYT